MSIERHGSGGPWEPIVGYSRVVKAGPIVEVAGCTAVDGEGHIVGGASVYEQSRKALSNVIAALATVGAKPADVIRTRLFITDISRWKDLGRAHGEVFGDIRPVTAMYGISALLDPRMLVEIEATAYIPDSGVPPGG
jgi:enamine deaminase RidA (YjgF/YER057c/UK114 family)